MKYARWSLSLHVKFKSVDAVQFPVRSYRKLPRGFDGTLSNLETSKHAKTAPSSITLTLLSYWFAVIVSLASLAQTRSISYPSTLHLLQPFVLRISVGWNFWRNPKKICYSLTRSESEMNSLQFFFQSLEGEFFCFFISALSTPWRILVARLTPLRHELNKETFT